MERRDIQKLRSLTTFEGLVDYLRDELDWPIEVEDADDLVFDYTPEELGIDASHAAKIEAIKQIRPLTAGQPWGIFYLEFETKRLPIVVMRRILRAFVSRGRSHSPDQPVWDMDDLLFVSSFGGDGTGEREIAFAHFHQEAGDLPTLRVLGWDGADTALKLDHVAATLKACLRWPDDPDDAEGWRAQWVPAFRHRVGHVIRTADALAERLALLARGIRDAATTLMALETEQGPLRRLHKAFQVALLHDLTEADFADTYAQTITYGLLTAAISRTEMSEGVYGTALVAGNVTDLVPITNPFLKEMLETFIHVGGRQGGIDFDELGVQDVVELLRGDETDLPAILRDFGNRTRGEDPVIHFYEHFLAAYDKQLKVQRGIFYTPQPVVSYIVRSVHELLQSEFGLEDGLASTVTWGEMAQRHAELTLPEGTDPASPFVVILDPATGTATFLVEIIDVIHRTLTDKWRRQGLTDTQRREAWNAYVPKHLLPRLYGYELMMAPYAIAHMKLGLKLYETGYRFGSDERVRVYLTNALEPAAADDAQIAFDFAVPALAHEAQAVNEVKRRVAFTVVSGNPPYSVTSLNKNAFIDALMNDYKRAVRGERGLVALSDDYLKFIRLAHHCIQRSEMGIVGVVTNRGYLGGIVHRGVRQQLTDFFSGICVVDLHGDSNIGETPPMDTRTRMCLTSNKVCITLLVRSSRDACSSIAYEEVWGSARQKYDYLLARDTRTTSFRPLESSDENCFFVPFDNSYQDEYRKLVAIQEAFVVGSCGVKTHRDALVIDIDKDTLKERILDTATSDDLKRLKRDYGIRDTKHWSLDSAKRNMVADEVEGLIRKLVYRPFDLRYIYYNRDIIEKGDSKYPTLRHMLDGSNLALLTARIQAKGVFDAVYCSRYLVEMKTAESTRSSTVFPLYRYTDERQTLLSYDDEPTNHRYRTPNMARHLIALCSSKWQLSFVSEGRGDLDKTFGPEDIFHYIYAVLYSPGYRSRYVDYLLTEFPRLPLTSDRSLLRRLVELGADLVALHLLEHDYPAASWRRDSGSCPLWQTITSFVERETGMQMGAFSKSTCYEDCRVYLDTSNRRQSSYFDGIPQDVWEFQVGGYQVLYKWLYDRRATGKTPGRVLTAEDIAHYQRIVVALKETIRLMAEIDAVIEEHGGWPIQ